MAAVLAMSKEIGEAPDARQAVCDAVARLTEARFVHLLEPAAPGWLARTAGAGSAVGPLRVPLDDEPSGMSTAFNTGRRRFVADTSADPLLASRLTTATGCATVLFEPLLAGGRVLGVLVLGWGDRSEVAFAPSAVRLLAAETAVALDRADRLARLDEQAATDPLTGLLNRRAWDVALAEAIRSSTQARSPLTVAMLDVDHFKAYNDAQGHQAGDRLLKAAAAAWRDALRPGDLLARYGGEEFVALLAGCGAEDAAPVAERLRAATPFGATSSVGLAQWEPGDSAEALLRRADEALYRAKRTGRDRVIAG
jgi:diguanylate cyclase (GGDEF)-like protein